MTTTVPSASVFPCRLESLYLGLGCMQPEISSPNQECSNPDAWHMYNDMATEVEVLQFLYALVRMLKPWVVVETGTYLGHGTVFLAQAVSDNGLGIVHSAEPEPDRVVQARTLLQSMALESHVTVWQATGQNLIHQINEPIDFAFLDSSFESRIVEMEALYSKLPTGGVVAVHDTSTFHSSQGGPRAPLLKLACDLGMQAFNFDTPRGLMLLRKGPPIP